MLENEQIALIVIEDILRVMNGGFEGVAVAQAFAASEALQRHGMQLLNVFDAQKERLVHY